MLLVANLAIKKQGKKPEKFQNSCRWVVIEVRELSNEYQRDRVKIDFKILCFIVLRMK